MLPPNLWMANAPGSTLFMPVGDASEQMLGFLAMAISNGSFIVDDEVKRPAGDLARFVRSGLLDEAKPTPLSVLHLMAYEANCAELAFVGHNMVLALQAMGLGGLYFNGVNRWSVLGAFAEGGIQGLGFGFTRDERWTLSGPWRDTAGVKGGVERYSDELVDCLGEVAQYIHDTHDRFPATPTTIVLSGYVQAVHLDTDFYDAHYAPGAYLPTHRDHWQTWHADDSP